MARARLGLLLPSLALIPTLLLCQNQVELVNGPLDTLKASDAAAVIAWTHNQNGTPDMAGLRALLRATLFPSGDAALLDNQDFYCILHFVSAPVGQEVTQAWFLYRGADTVPPYPLGPTWKGDDVLAQRIYGASTVALLYVYVSATDTTKDPSKAVYPPTYKVTITKETSTPAADLGQLVQYALNANATPKSQKSVQAAPPPPLYLWGGRVLAVRYKPSQILVEASVRTQDKTPVLQSIGKQTFDNEGRTWWDVSIAVPIHSVSELSYSSDSGRVSASKIDREKVFAILDLFPFRVDPKGRGFRWVPLMIGVSLADKPFDHLLVGTGFGWKGINAFAAAALSNDNKPATLSVGSTATPSQLSNDRRTHYVGKLALGLNISPGAVLSAAK